MMITTRFIAPTDSRGSRIKATINGRRASYGDRSDYSVTIPFPYALSGTDTHMEAAQAVVAKWNAAARKISADMGQDPQYANVIDGVFSLVGESADGRGYVFSCPSRYAPAFIAASAGVTF